jgi:hypothetical protein
MLEEETETDRLRRTLAESHADLQRRDAALLKLQRELMVSRREVAGAREETVQFQGMLRRAEAAAAAAMETCTRLEAEAEAEAASRTAEIAQLQTVITTLQGEASALRASMHLVYASASWRMSAPVRVVGQLMRSVRNAAGLRRAIRGASPHQTPPLSPAALPSPADPNIVAIFQAAPFVEPPSGEGEGVVTLDALYRLSRSL